MGQGEIIKQRCISSIAGFRKTEIIASGKFCFYGHLQFTFRELQRVKFALADAIGCTDSVI
jgi:hypothetical protein